MAFGCLGDLVDSHGTGCRDRHLQPACTERDADLPRCRDELVGTAACLYRVKWLQLPAVVSSRFRPFRLAATSDLRNPVAMGGSCRSRLRSLALHKPDRFEMVNRAPNWRHASFWLHSCCTGNVGGQQPFGSLWH